MECARAHTLMRACVRARARVRLRACLRACLHAACKQARACVRAYFCTYLFNIFVRTNVIFLYVLIFVRTRFCTCRRACEVSFFFVLERGSVSFLCVLYLCAGACRTSSQYGCVSYNLVVEFLVIRSRYIIPRCIISLYNSSIYNLVV